ncbi:protein ANTAGONIST OF LIKE HETEROCHROMATIN PROTEIN 1 [Denticeps clupeoides]|uniref:DDE Tnp4 domain-containing protein n=1 Tax=Denticeps clupeoides TaxID=299321 RepID=A0AAY4EDN4_9TELE|nr:protein ANTAGONIST OF LIKE HETEROCHROMATIN PROTEIN 1-like [Denticeps clupeoides]
MNPPDPKARVCADPANMSDGEAQRPLTFMLTYLLMKRRRDLNGAEARRRTEVRRRVRHRQYFLQRQRRTLMMLLTQSSRSCTCPLRSRVWSNTESTDWWERVVMHEFQPADWLEKFRMSKETFFYLCGILKPRLARQDTRLRPALPLEKRIAVALWRLATNVEYRIISELFGVGRSTVCKCVRDVCHAIAAILKPLYLRTPSEQELEDTTEVFQSRWGFPHCVGALGSLHVPIIAPSSNTDSYWNSSGWLSVVMQGAVNGLGQFWDVCAGFPGGTEHADILQNSTLWALGREGGLRPDPPRSFMGQPLGYLILGDAGYPLQSWLLKCYPESSHLTTGQHLFNLRLKWARRVVDDAFLRLRARWQCLHKRNDCGIDVVPTMVLACCILHNVCEVHGDTFVEEWVGAVKQGECPQPQFTTPPSSDEDEGEEVRAMYCQYFLQQVKRQDHAVGRCREIRT